MMFNKTILVQVKCCNIMKTAYHYIVFTSISAFNVF